MGYATPVGISSTPPPGQTRNPKGSFLRKPEAPGVPSELPLSADSGHSPGGYWTAQVDPELTFMTAPAGEPHHRKGEMNRLTDMSYQ